ncbi:MAG: response regulator [Janthinobacterium lividum]
MRIRTRLFLIAVCVLVLALLIGAFAGLKLYREVRNANRDAVQEKVRALGRALDDQFALREQLLKGLAESALIDAQDLAPFLDQARALAARTGSTIELHGVAGNAILSTALPLGAATPAELFGFRLPLPNPVQHPVLSDLFHWPLTRTDVFALRIPVVRGALPPRELTMVVPAASLQALLDQFAAATGVTTAILDRQDVIVARSAGSAQSPGRQIGQPLRQKLDSSKDGMLPLSLDDDESMVTFHQRSPVSGYRVMICVPSQNIDRKAVNAALQLGGMLLALLCLGALGMALLVRRALACAEVLRQAANELSRAQPFNARQTGIAELDAVAATMARASVELRSGKAEIERQVNENMALNANVRDALQQEQKLEAMGRLTGGIAHDFNNVLQTLTSGLQMAHGSVTEARARMLLETCERAVRRAVELTSQLMAIGQSNDGEMMTVDLGARIHSMNRLLRGALPAGVDLRLQIADDLWPVTIDAMQFELTLLNLTINARDAMASNGTINLTAYNETLLHDIGELRAGEYVLLSLHEDADEADVANAVAGVDRTVAAFTGARAHLAGWQEPDVGMRRAASNAGHGLPQAYGFARQCGGTLLVQNQGSHDSLVLLYLPRTPENETTASEIAVLRSAPAAIAGRLLYVEDDLLVREVVSPALREAGFDVTDAFDGDAALALLESGQQFDLVFSDITMPGELNGIDLARIVGRDYPFVRVILTTGYSHERLTVPGVRVIAKPYVIGDVVTELHQELDTVRTR